METQRQPQTPGAERPIQELGIRLPLAPTPCGAYVPAVQSGDLLFLSGMLPTVGHQAQIVGRLGKLFMFVNRLGRSPATGRRQFGEYV
jgi:hypothetical protein